MKRTLFNFLILINISIFAVERDTGPYRIKDYSYLFGKLEGIDDALLKMHFTLYQGYVNNTNLLSQTLKEMANRGEDRTIAYGALKRRFVWEFDGMILHELYFENMGKSGSLSSKCALFQKITNSFGSFQKWKQNFLATGMIRGIGWVILYEDPIDDLLHNIWVDEHNINHIAGAKPLLVMDVWEHAYLTQYGLDRMGYLQAFFENINWTVVETRFSSLQETRPLSHSKR